MILFIHRHIASLIILITVFAMPALSLPMIPPRALPSLALAMPDVKEEIKENIEELKEPISPIGHIWERMQEMERGAIVSVLLDHLQSKDAVGCIANYLIFFPTLISAGLTTSFFEHNGLLWSWGDNDNGQLGDGTKKNRLSPQSVFNDPDDYVVQVVGGFAHTLTLSAKGKLSSCGQNDQGQLGDGGKISRLLPHEPLNIMNVKQIAAGESWSFLLTGQGEVYRLNDYETVKFNKKTSVVQIAAAGDRLFMLTDTGMVYDGNLDLDLKAALVPIAKKVSQIVAAKNCLLALTAENELWVYGLKGLEILGYPEEETRIIEQVYMPIPDKIVQIATGGHHGVVLLENGHVYVFGNAKYDRLGLNRQETSAIPIHIPMKGRHIIQVAAGLNHSMALAYNDNDKLWEIITWGGNGYSQLGEITKANSDLPFRICRLQGSATKCCSILIEIPPRPEPVHDAIVDPKVHCCSRACIIM